MKDLPSSADARIAVRLPADLKRESDTWARLLGLKPSDYVRVALDERNRRSRAAYGAALLADDRAAFSAFATALTGAAGEHAHIGISLTKTNEPTLEVLPQSSPAARSGCLTTDGHVDGNPLRVRVAPRVHVTPDAVVLMLELTDERHREPRRHYASLGRMPNNDDLRMAYAEASGLADRATCVAVRDPVTRALALPGPDDRDVEPVDLDSYVLLLADLDRIEPRDLADAIDNFTPPD